MVGHNKEQIYVAELRMPSCFRPSNVEREVIPNPLGFKINRGYWKVCPPDEQSTVEGHPEISLIIEFVQMTLRDAEDHALKVGSMFSSIASAYGGYPLGPPNLHRIASVGGGLTSQHHYFYGPSPYMLSVFDQTIKYRFQGYLQAISSIDDNTKYRLRSAIYWYGMSISADDPTVSYVAAWTGLECIGPAINGLCHPNGTKTSCEVCKNKAGEGRDKKLAGIDHTFGLLQSDSLPLSLSEEAEERMTNELRDQFSRKKAGKLRNRVVHGLGDIEELTQECLEFRRHLMYVLLTSIQVTLHLSSDSTVGSWIPGDFDFRPDARISLKFKEELRKSPYYDEWIGGLQWQAEPGAKENQTWTLEREWTLDNTLVRLVESKSFEIFERGVDVHSSAAGSILTELTSWNDRLTEPRWEQPDEQT